MKLPVFVLLFLALSGAASAGRGRPPREAPARVAIGVCIDVDRLEAAKAAGFEYVEVNASRIAGLSAEDFQRAADRAGRLGIPVASANSFIPAAIKITGPDIDKAAQEDYVRRTLRRLKTLGVSVVVFGSGGARRVPEGFGAEEAFSQLVDFCRRMASIARDNGITIAVEPLRRRETNIVNTAREGLRLVKAVDRPEIRLLVDYFHLAEEGEDPAVLLEAGSLVVHTHIANPKGRVYPQSLEEADYAGFFRNLCKIGYSGRMSVEASTSDFETEAPRAVSMLRQALACR